jgi:hypothetical protein
MSSFDWVASKFFLAIATCVFCSISLRSCDRVLHALDEVLPLVEQLLHRHRHRGGPQRVDEFVFDQLF